MGLYTGLNRRRGTYVNFAWMRGSSTTFRAAAAAANLFLHKSFGILKREATTAGWSRGKLPTLAINRLSGENTGKMKRETRWQIKFVLFPVSFSPSLLPSPPLCPPFFPPFTFTFHFLFFFSPFFLVGYFLFKARRKILWNLREGSGGKSWRNSDPKLMLPLKLARALGVVGVS